MILLMMEQQATKILVLTRVYRKIEKLILQCYTVALEDYCMNMISGLDLTCNVPHLPINNIKK